MEKFKLKSLKRYASLCAIIFFLVSVTVGCTSTTTANEKKEDTQVVENNKNQDNKKDEEVATKPKEEEASQSDKNSQNTNNSSSNSKEDLFKGYKLIKVDGGNLSGHREPNVVVDIGFGDREYYAFTNEYGQLVKVVANKITLQNDKKEPVTSSGRYYKDEAKVPGTERKDLDEGHVIADSLGGVSNAYNITPQNSTLNRHGDQAYMEKAIREAGGCTDFVAIITYPDTKTQIPSHYSYTYKLKGNVIKDEFDNINPDEANESLNSSSNSSSNTNSNNTSSNSGTTASSSKAKVYWTPSGKSYHTTKSCHTLSRSKTILEGTIKESGKSDPCDSCH